MEERVSAFQLHSPTRRLLDSSVSKPNCSDSSLVSISRARTESRLKVTLPVGVPTRTGTDVSFRGRNGYRPYEHREWTVSRGRARCGRRGQYRSLGNSRDLCMCHFLPISYIGPNPLPSPYHLPSVWRWQQHSAHRSSSSTSTTSLASAFMAQVFPFNDG
jgi:hypothetical protein